MDFQAELSKLEKQIQQQTIQKAQLEQKIQTLGEERTKLLSELAKENIAEEDLAQAIATLEMDTEALINECKEVLA